MLKKVLFLAVAITFSPSLKAQNVDATMLLHPPADSWPGYHGDYSGQRHSHLTQITPQNVANLSSGVGLSNRPTGGD